MSWQNIVILLPLLALTTLVQSQFYDVFQGFQPFIQTYQTTRRPYQRPQQNTNRKLIGDSYTTSNERHTSSEEARQQTYERDGYRQTSYERVEPRLTQKSRRKLTTTTTSIFNLSYYTTPKPVRKSNKNTSHRQFDTDQEPARGFARSNVNQDLTDASVPNSNSENRRQWHDESVNNIAGNYYSTRPTTTTKRNYVTTRPNYGTTRPNYGTPRPNYGTTKRNNVTTKNIYNPNDVSRPNYDVNSLYTTYNPIDRPGVRPANVDVNKPPITNKPPSLAVYPRPTDSSVIRFPEDPDTSPEVTAGVDEDNMSYAERRRYIEMAEKMCDKYKSLSVKKVEAIPLVPSPEPVQVNVSTCSQTSVPLVVGGKVVTIQEFPHMALLGWTKIEDGGYSWKCGGSLISDQFILTASHCAYQDKDDAVVTGAPRVVQLGSSYLDDSGALVVKVLSVIRHPKYIQTRSYYDVALVKMVTPVTFSEVVKPACLGEPPGVGEPIIATGWGRTEFGGSQSLELRSVSVPVWDIEECHRKLGTSRKLPQGPSRDSQICAGEKKGGKDTCQGDSGGPAQIQDGCAWRVVAVTSVGRSCGAPNTPALYATLHKAFIAAHVFAKSESQSNNKNGNNGNNRVQYPNNDNNNENQNVNNGNINREQTYNNGNGNGNRNNGYDNKDRYPNTDNNNGNGNINNGDNYNGNRNRNNQPGMHGFNENKNPSNSHIDNVNNSPQIILNYGNAESGNRNNDYNRNQPNAHRSRSPDSYYNNHNVGTTSNGDSNSKEQANNAQGTNYSPNPYSYDNNNGNVYNNNNNPRNGYNNNGNRNDNYGTSRYGITEEPTFNNAGSWW